MSTISRINLLRLLGLAAFIIAGWAFIGLRLSPASLAVGIACTGTAIMTAIDATEENSRPTEGAWLRPMITVNLAVSSIAAAIITSVMR